MLAIQVIWGTQANIGLSWRLSDVAGGVCR